MTELEAKLDGLVARMEKHQAALKLSDVRFAARYQRHLGSAKTWRDRLCARAWGEFGGSLEKWVKKLSAMASEVEGTIDLTEFFEGLPIARYGQQVYDTLQGQRSDRRCAWLIAPTGVGKSWSMQALARQNQLAATYLHFNRGAKDSLPVIARALARAVGATEEASAAGTYGNVIETLKANALTLLLDDMHEGGVLAMKLVKHLIDDTRGKFILGTYPTAFARLVNGSSEAHAEAQQLIGRSLKPIENRWVNGVTEDDVTAYLKLALGGNGEARVAARALTPTLRKNGNLRALADAVELARMNADDEGAELSADLVEAAVRELCPVERKN